MGTATGARPPARSGADVRVRSSGRWGTWMGAVFNVARGSLSDADGAVRAWSKVVSVSAAVLAGHGGVWNVLDWMVGESRACYLGCRPCSYFPTRTHLSVHVVLLCHSESPPFPCNGGPEWKKVQQIENVDSVHQSRVESEGFETESVDVYQSPEPRK